MCKRISVGICSLKNSRQAFVNVIEKTVVEDNIAQGRVLWIASSIRQDAITSQSYTTSDGATRTFPTTEAEFDCQACVGNRGSTDPTHTRNPEKPRRCKHLDVDSVEWKCPGCRNHMRRGTQHTNIEGECKKPLARRVHGRARTAGHCPEAPSPQQPDLARATQLHDQVPAWGPRRHLRPIQGVPLAAVGTRLIV